MSPGSTLLRAGGAVLDVIHGEDLTLTRAGGTTVSIRGTVDKPDRQDSTGLRPNFQQEGQSTIEIKLGQVTPEPSVGESITDQEGLVHRLDKALPPRDGYLMFAGDYNE